MKKAIIFTFVVLAFCFLTSCKRTMNKDNSEESSDEAFHIGDSSAVVNTDIKHEFSSKEQIQQDVFKINKSLVDENSIIENIVNIGNHKLLFISYKDSKQYVSIYSYAENKIIKSAQLPKAKSREIGYVKNGFYVVCSSFDPTNPKNRIDEEDRICDVYIYNYNLEKINQVKVTRTGLIFNMALSNDLKTLIYEKNDGQNWAIAKLDLKTSKETNLFQREIDKEKVVNEIVNMSRLMFTSDDKQILFVGHVFPSSTSEHTISTYGAIDLNGKVIYNKTAEFDLQYKTFDNGYFEYDQMREFKELANGKATIYDNSSKSVKEFVFKNNKESQDCTISNTGKYICSLYEYLDKNGKSCAYFSIYDTQSGELLKTFNYVAKNSKAIGVHDYFIDEQSKCIIANVSESEFMGVQILQFCF